MEIKSLKILAAEDDQFQQIALEMILKQTGYSPEIYPDGKKAVMAFIKNPGRYIIVLLDLNMPVMNGYKAAKHIRKRDKKIKIIACSAGYFSHCY